LPSNCRRDKSILALRLCATSRTWGAARKRTSTGWQSPGPAHAGDAGVDKRLVDDGAHEQADQGWRESVSHGRYVAFRLADVAIPPYLFADILRMIAKLRPPPFASTA